MSHNKTVHQIMDNVNKALIGKGEVVRLTVTTLLAGGHLLLEDVPGVGKTTLAHALAATIGCSFGRIQFTPDTLPGDVTGISVYRAASGQFEYMDGPVRNHIVLADEINRTSPKTQAALLEAMGEGQVTVDGITHALPSPFMVIATQNPIDFIGTYHLPEAQLDRFLIKMSIGYPSTQEECRMGKLFLEGDPLGGLSAVTSEDELREIQEEVARIHVQKDVVAYVVDIINETRNSEHVSLGASPRATLALLRASQANAYIEGRDFVLPDDVQQMAKHVLSHRLVPSVEAKVGNHGPEQVIRSILKNVHVPLRT